MPQSETAEILYQEWRDACARVDRFHEKDREAMASFANIEFSGWLTGFTKAVQAMGDDNLAKEGRALILLWPYRYDRASSEAFLRKFQEEPFSDVIRRLWDESEAS